MKASTFGFEEIGAEHVILVSWDGEVLEGDGRRHAEYPIHTELMRARPDVGSVVHTHAPWAVAFASTGQPLRPISHEATLFVPPRRRALHEDRRPDPDRRSSARRRGGPRRPQRRFMLSTTASSPAAPTSSTAVMTAVLLERACRTNIRD